MWSYILFAVLLPACCLSQQQNPLPQAFPAVVSEGHEGVCPSAEESAAIIEDIFDQVMAHLNIIQPPCPCGGPGQWTRIAHLNLSDPSQQCPSSWSLITTPVRGCRRSAGFGPACDSVTFASTGQPYSRVCGRVIAYQKGTPDAFSQSIAFPSGLEDIYVDGVSLSHGADGSRQHIWTFVAALYEGTAATSAVCPCTRSDRTWPHEVPEFVGDDYFCDTGTDNNVDSRTFYTGDPLWDGKGCGSTSTCCEFNNPPWFCTTLPQPITDDIEARICLNSERSSEDIIVSLLDIYVM